MTINSVTTKAVGSAIACGEQIGGVGTSGNSTGFHLHFEVRVSGATDDPYSGTCGGPISYWVNQNNGHPTTDCEAVAGPPAAPSGLAASATSASQISLSWTDNASNETGFKVERATLPGGAWSQIASANSNVTSYANTGLSNSSTYFYRVRAYNTNGDSAYSNVATATTSNAAPVLAAITSRTANEGSALTFIATATDGSLGVTRVITDFESYPSGSAGGNVMFRQPTYSGTTSGYLDPSPNTSSVTDSFPAGNSSTRALNINWSFTNGAVNPWLRLTTYNPTDLPNPVVSLQQILRFDIRTDKSLLVGLGLRETNTTADIGANGGTTGPIEFVGVTNKTGTTPLPTRVAPTGSWTNLQFTIPAEPVVPFTGNGILESSTGKGVLEHLAFVPAAGLGAYNVYVDNFTTTLPNTLAYSLSNAPAGAAINPTNGTFTWTPTEAQGPGVYAITVRVTDNGSPAMNDAKTFTVTVKEVNQAPVLAPISNRIVNAGTTLTLTNTATDEDFPPNTLSFSLAPGAPSGATVGASDGVFRWTASQTSVPLTNTFTARVTDDGSPPLTNSQSFNITVVPPPRISSIAAGSGNVVLAWQTYPGKTYRVQFKNDLNETNWLVFGDDIIAMGDILSFTNNTGTGPRRFYRIVQVE